MPLSEIPADDTLVLQAVQSQEACQLRICANYRRDDNARREGRSRANIAKAKAIAIRL
jgi:hypothetical protein